MAATAKSIQNEMDLIEKAPAPVTWSGMLTRGFGLVERHVIQA
jgi:hypothetical protein